MRRVKEIELEIIKLEKELETIKNKKTTEIVNVLETNGFIRTYNEWFTEERIGELKFTVDEMNYIIRFNEQTMILQDLQINRANVPSGENYMKSSEKPYTSKTLDRMILFHYVVRELFQL